MVGVGGASNSQAVSGVIRRVLLPRKESGWVGRTPRLRDFADRPQPYDRPRNAGEIERNSPPQNPQVEARQGRLRGGSRTGGPIGEMPPQATCAAGALGMGGCERSCSAVGGPKPETTDGLVLLVGGDFGWEGVGFPRSKDARFSDNATLGFLPCNRG